MKSPISTSSSEVWGSDFKSWDCSANENTYLSFCKRYLKAHNKASNFARKAGKLFFKKRALLIHCPKERDGNYDS